MDENCLVLVDVPQSFLSAHGLPVTPRSAGGLHRAHGGHPHYLHAPPDCYVALRRYVVVLCCVCSYVLLC